MTFKETDLLNAWLWQFHRTDVQWRRVRLGVLPTKALARMYMTILRWADAIFLKDGIVHIVEAKLRPDLGAIGQLEGYEKLFKQTPEFSAYQNWPIQKILLTTMRDLNVIQLASDKEIQYVVYTQDEVNRTRTEQMLPVV